MSATAAAAVDAAVAVTDDTEIHHTSNPNISIDETDRQTHPIENDATCDVCGECRPNVVVLRCDACHCRVHLTCTVPRLSAKPRQRRWWCDSCRQNPVSGSWSLTAAETSGEVDKEVKKLQREKERHQQALEKAERQRLNQEREEQWQQQQKEAEEARQTQQPSEQPTAVVPSAPLIPSSTSASSGANHEEDEKMAESADTVSRKRKPEGGDEINNQQPADDSNSPKRLRSSASGVSDASGDTVPATVETSPVKQEKSTSSPATVSPSSVSRQLSTATPLKGPVPLARKAPTPLGSSSLATQSTLQRPSPSSVPLTSSGNNSTTQFALGVTDQKVEQQRLDALKAKIKEAKDQQLLKQMKSEPIVSKPSAAPTPAAAAVVPTPPSSAQPIATATTNPSTAAPPSPSAATFPPLQTATKSPLKSNKTPLTNSPAKPAAKSPRSLAAATITPPASTSDPSSPDLRHSQFQGLLLKHLKTFPEAAQLESQRFKKKVEPEANTEEMKENEKAAKAAKAKHASPAVPSFVQTNALNELVLSVDTSMQKRYGDKYVSCFRTLISNLRANNDITRQVIAGTISPAQLSSMQSSDFDDAEVRARKHALAQEEMKMSIVERPKQNNALSQYTESVIDQLGVLNATSLERSIAKPESDANNDESDGLPPLEGFDYLKHAMNNVGTPVTATQSSANTLEEIPQVSTAVPVSTDKQPVTPKGAPKSSVPTSQEKPKKPKELITVSDDDSDVIMEEDVQSVTRASIAASNMEAAAKSLPALPDFHSFDAQMSPDPEDMEDEAPIGRAIGFDDDEDGPTDRRDNRSPSPPTTSSVRESGRGGSSVASSLSSHRSDSPSSFASVDAPSNAKSQSDSDALWVGFMRWGKELIGLRALDVSPLSSSKTLQVFKNSMPRVVDISMRAPFPTVLHSFKQAAAATKADSTRISSKGTLAIAKLESRDRSTSSSLHPLHKIIEFHTNKERIALVKWKTNKAELGSCEGFLILAKPDGILSATVLQQLFGVSIEEGSVYLCVHVSAAAGAKKPSTPTASSKPSVSTPTAAAASSVVIPAIPPALQALSSITSQGSAPPTPALQRTESQNSQYSATNSPYPPATTPIQPVAVAYPYPPSAPAVVAPVPVPSAPSPHLPYPPMQPAEMQHGMDTNRAPPPPPPPLPTSHYPAAPTYIEPPSHSMSSDWDRGRERERGRDPTWDRQYEQDSYRNPRDSRGYPSRDYNSHAPPPSDSRGRPARSRSRSRSPSRRYGAPAAPITSPSGGIGRGFVHPDRVAMVPNRDPTVHDRSRDRDRDRYDSRGPPLQYDNNEGYRGRDDYSGDRRPYQGGRDNSTYSPNQRPRDFGRERGYDRDREWEVNERSYGRDADRQPYPSSQHQQSNYPQPPPAQSHSAQSYPYPANSSYSAPSRDEPASAVPYPAQTPYQPYPAAAPPQYHSSHHANSYPQPPSEYSQYAHPPPPPPPPPPPHVSRDAPWLRK